MIHVAYYTDPLCPWSWAAEPELRRILVEFSEQVQITYVMAGMARDLQADQKLESTLDAVAETGMPADPRMWLECPPSSSYPACVAVKAAEAQDLGAAYLRRLREAIFLLRRPEDFSGVAAEVAGLDAGRFAADLGSDAATAAFEADREQALAACGDDRPSLPAFSVEGGEPIGKADLRDAVLAAGARPAELPDAAGALEHFPLLADAEVAAICGLDRTRARTELWRLAAEGRARVEDLPFGELWRAA